MCYSALRSADAALRIPAKHVAEIAQIRRRCCAICVYLLKVRVKRSAIQSAEQHRSGGDMRSLAAQIKRISLRYRRILVAEYASADQRRSAQPDHAYSALALR